MSPITCRFVCLSVQKVYCGKMADWIRMLFGMVSGVGQGMGVLDRCPCGWRCTLPKLLWGGLVTRSPAVARMADCTAPVIKLTLILTLTGHNPAKTGPSPLNGYIMRQNEAYRAIFCTSKTTSGCVN